MLPVKKLGPVVTTGSKFMILETGQKAAWLLYYYISQLFPIYSSTTELGAPKHPQDCFRSIRLAVGLKRLVVSLRFVGLALLHNC